MQGLIIDNFAGGGGASTGIEMAIGRSVDVAINHDADGNEYPKKEQTAKCGNAVTPPVACALVRANLPELCERR